MQETPLEDILPTIEHLRASFDAGTTRPLEYRINQIKQLGYLLHDNTSAIQEALEKDLGRNSIETSTIEINPVLSEINFALANIHKWVKPYKPPTTMTWSALDPKVMREPKGVVLIATPFNYPLYLTLGQLIGAIAAGNCVVVKPSENVIHISSLFADLFPRYFDQNTIRLITGSIPHMQALLQEPWGHIMYTGSPKVGSIVASAAGKTLTPVTLELGGKSPTIIMPDANISIAAKRIVWGKSINAGQTCLAPDYVICHKSVEEQFTKAVLDAAIGLFTEANVLESDQFAKIVNKQHFDRITSLLANTKGTVFYGGASNADSLKIELTFVKNVDHDDSLMQEELFGPVLPFMTYEHFDDLPQIIRKHNQPLSIYLFTSNKQNREALRERTQSGSIVFNDTIIQCAVVNLPFGGIGNSGNGAWHGKATFDSFTYERSQVYVPSYLEGLLTSRYPPYTSQKIESSRVIQNAIVKYPRPAAVGTTAPATGQGSVSYMSIYMEFLRVLWKRLATRGSKKPFLFFAPLIVIFFIIPKLRSIL